MSQITQQQKDELIKIIKEAVQQAKQQKSLNDKKSVIYNSIKSWQDKNNLELQNYKKFSTRSKVDINEHNIDQILQNLDQHTSKILNIAQLIDDSKQIQQQSSLIEPQQQQQIREQSPEQIKEQKTSQLQSILRHFKSKTPGIQQSSELEYEQSPTRIRLKHLKLKPIKFQNKKKQEQQQQVIDNQQDIDKYKLKTEQNNKLSKNIKPEKTFKICAQSVFRLRDIE